MDRWKGRVALVTGASSGIGAGLVQRLTSRGMNVVGCARRMDKLQELANKVKDAPGRFHPIKCDLRQEAEIKAMYDVIGKEHGGVDVCINNAGAFCSTSLIGDETEKWRQEWEVNVLARCICTREYLKSMKERGVDDGHIININSVVGHMVLPVGASHYSATKWACRALAMGLRQELRQAKSNIRVTDISPGTTATEIAINLYGGDEASLRQAFEHRPHLKVKDMEDTVENVLSSPPHVEIHDIIVANAWNAVLPGCAPSTKQVTTAD